MTHLHKADGAAATQLHQVLHSGLAESPPNWTQLDSPDLYKHGNVAYMEHHLSAFQHALLSLHMSAHVRRLWL
jgi:hypothetical protein